MSELRAVIGANYGDEGKGLVTDYLCGEALKEGKSCMVILGNGGAQRGHTVETEEGQRFVFHHLGSGSLLGVPSFFCSDFILNPLIFKKDWAALLELTEQDPDFRLPVIFSDDRCRFTTPYDMMVNQMLEDARGEERHGSVGLGIWETVRRYDHDEGISFRMFLKQSLDDKLNYLGQVKAYAEQRLADRLGGDFRKRADLGKWQEIWDSELVPLNFISDCEEMADLICFLQVPDLANYDILVVENGQGLLLGQNRYNGRNFTTPSDTGALQIRRLLDGGMRAFVKDLQLNYVTRTYLTKHGAGNFDGECPAAEIHPAMEDLTNVPNAYQGTIRYGVLQPNQLARQIREDLADMGNDHYQIRLVVTHANEADAEPLIRGVRAAGFGQDEMEILISGDHTRASVYREA